MKVKIDNQTYNYLLKNILILKQDLNNSMKIEKNKDFLIIELDEDNACVISDLAGELLQKCGFDKNYELTPEGKILEKIEDLFYV